MFELEQSLTEWRRRMLAAGIKTPVPLEELESHLREEITRKMETGLAAAEAFTFAVKRIGIPQSLNNEFSKNERKQMKRILLIGFGVVGVLLGAAFIMPALAWYRHHDVPIFSAPPWKMILLGHVIVIAGIISAWQGMKKHRTV